MFLFVCICVGVSCVVAALSEINLCLLRSKGVYPVTVVASGSRLLAVRAVLEADTAMTFWFSGYAMGPLVLSTPCALPGNWVSW